MNRKNNNITKNVFPYAILLVIIVGTLFLLNLNGVKVNELTAGELLKEMNSNNVTEITITPGEGVLVRFSIDSESGSAGSTVKIYESLTKGGTYYQIGQSSAGTAVEIPVRKNAYVKYEVIQGPCRNKLEEHYIFDGIVTIKTGDDTTKSNGRKLSTKFEKNYGFSLFGGAKSTSTDTLISGDSTIHAYIKN